MPLLVYIRPRPYVWLLASGWGDKVSELNSFSILSSSSTGYEPSSHPRKALSIPFLQPILGDFIHLAVCLPFAALSASQFWCSLRGQLTISSFDYACAVRVASHHLYPTQFGEGHFLRRSHQSCDQSSLPIKGLNL